MTDLDPLCLKGEIAMAVSNRGELLPCCRCDEPNTLSDPDFVKLLKVSRIEDFENIDQILEQKEWHDFKNNLENGVGFNACYWTCKKNKTESEIQKMKFFDNKNKKPNRTEKR